MKTAFPYSLVVRLGAMGDVIHALPAVASLKHSFPHSHLTWVVRPRWMPLLEGNPFLDRTDSARAQHARHGGSAQPPALPAIRSRGRSAGTDSVRDESRQRLARTNRRLSSFAGAGTMGIAVLFSSRGHERPRISSIRIWNSWLPRAHRTSFATFPIPEGSRKANCRPENSCWPARSPDGDRNNGR